MLSTRGVREIPWSFKIIEDSAEIVTLFASKIYSKRSSRYKQTLKHVGAVKTLTRTVVVKCYANGSAKRALRDIKDSYRRMPEDMIDYTVKYMVSQSILHRVFYRKFREYP